MLLPFERYYFPLQDTRKSFGELMAYAFGVELTIVLHTWYPNLTPRPR